MTISIGVVANVYNEANALPGWIECATSWADWVGVMHAGPQGAMSNDGTIEILEKWRIPTQYCAIDLGFGEVRTATLRMCPCDWVMLLDADERFFPVHHIMRCEGDGTPQSEVDWILQSYDFSGVNLPNWENLSKLGSDLRVVVSGAFDQAIILRDMLDIHRELDAIAVRRRHWHDLSFKRPTQNWHSEPDWQMRLLRNDPSIYFHPDTRMHEQICGVLHKHYADGLWGPFFDHFHFTFKRMEQEQRRHDIRIYDAIHEGKTPPKLEEVNK